MSRFHEKKAGSPNVASDSTGIRTSQAGGRVFSFVNCLLHSLAVYKCPGIPGNDEFLVCGNDEDFYA